MTGSARSMSEGQPGLIKVPLPKNCYLLLTPEELRRAIRRGRRQKRLETIQRREAR